MQSVKTAAKKFLLIVSAILLIGGAPLGVIAEGNSSSEETENKPPKYVYNEETDTWDSDQYRWDPNTGLTTELPKRGPTGTPGPTGQTGAKNSNNNGAAAQAGTTGPSSNNQATNNGTSNSQANSNNQLGVNNQLNANAQTGNSTVSGNTAAGSALSGDAQSIANILNMLQSSTSLGEQGIVTFQTDITGDVVGDLLINPDLIFNLGPNSQNTSENSVNASTDVNVNTDAAINNNIDLAATSGNATVDSNTEAGDATSGNAYVMANVVNVLNSVIAANKSFLGMVNIYGNLDGDILFPPETINSLLSSNMPTANVAINNVTGEVEVNNANNLNTTNNINLDASSGNANVGNNTSAGGATTGEAKTNLTVLNLTGSEVIASNSILVFVNVMGTWVGMIMDAPTGATAAALGGGVSQNTINAGATLDSTNNAAINNNINLSANTGDANVTNNTSAGNATSGNAYAAANVANINNSSLNVSNWFGLLFINVFGSWNGSFGVDTAAGNRPVMATTPAVDGSTSSVPQVFGFTTNQQSNTQAAKQYILAPNNSEGDDAPKVLLASAGNTGDSRGSGQGTGSVEELAKETSNNNKKVMLFTGFGVLVGVTMIGADKALSFMGRRSGKEEALAAGKVSDTTAASAE